MGTPNGGALGFLVLIELPMRELMLDLMRLSELPADGLCVVGAVGFLVLIILPMREDLLELIRSPELPFDGLLVTGEVCSLVPIRLPIAQLLLELMRLPELPADGLCVVGAPGFLVLIELPIREVVPELIRLPELVGTCFPVPGLVNADLPRLIELPVGQRVPEEIPCRPGVLDGRLSVILLDGLLIVTLPDERLLIPLLGVRMLDLVFLLEILSPEGLDVLILVGDLTDRDEVIVLTELDRELEGCRVLAEEARLAGLEACRLLALLALDLLLLLDLSAANAGSIISIRAKNTAETAILTFSLYFSVAMIRLLSTHNVITAIFETFCLFIKGTNPVSGNRNFAVFALFSG